jgi:hypothetical protein
METHLKYQLSKILVSVSITIFLSACYLSVTKGRLYNVSTPEIIEATFEPGGSGHGMIEAIAPNGERFKGE